jgi:CubicO group peptidase (beta-lactamase class C family)
LASDGSWTPEEGLDPDADPTFGAGPDEGLGVGGLSAALGRASSWPAPQVAAGVVLASRPGGPVAQVLQAGAHQIAQPWASVSKVLVALAVLVAVEEGTLDLDEPAGPPGATIRHLLAHASGLAPDERRVLAPPGRRRIYSNAGYEILAEALAARSGIPFDAYLAEGVLWPLSMQGTVLPPGASPASGVVGPLDDLLRLTAELLTPRLIDPGTLAEATAVAYPGLAGVVPGIGFFDPCDWGLGLEIRDDKVPHWTGTQASPRTFGHFGRSGSFLWVDPEVGCGCCGLTGRSFGPWALAVWPPFADAVLAAVAEARSLGRLASSG